MIKVFIFALAALFSLVVIKQIRPEFALSLRLCTVTVVFIAALSGIDTLIDYINDIYEFGSIDSSYVKLALKATGICIISHTVADICRDSAETAVATQVELVGRFLILALSLPLIRTLFEIVMGLIK